MSQAPAVPYDCNRCPSECLPTQVPGVPGTDGAPGQNGADGINAFTFTTAAFTMPAVSGTVVVEVLNTSWIVPEEGAAYGQALAVQFAGTLLVTNVIDGTHVELLNLGYTGNAAPGSVIPSGSKVSPSGVEGPAGADAGNAFLIVNNLSEGDLATKQANLGIGPSGGHADSFFFQVSKNLLEGVPATMRTNLGLGTAATKDAGIANLNLPPVDQVAGFTAGQAIFATASGVESKTAAAARTALGISGMVGNYVLLQNQQAGDAAAFASGGSVAVPLNTEVSDAGAVCSLNAGTFVFTLAAGTYRIRATVPAWSVGIFQALLFNVTLGSIVFYGTNGEAGSSAPVSSGVSFVVGRFTVPGGGADYQLRAQCVTRAGAGGFGKATGFGGTEIYASCELEQET